MAFRGGNSLANDCDFSCFNPGEVIPMPLRGLKALTSFDTELDRL